MAKIILTVDVQNKEALQGIKALETQIQGLSTSLSQVKVNKDLTAQINSLSKFFTSLSNAYAKTTASANKQALADEKLALAKQKTATQTAKTSTELVKEKLTLEKVNTEIVKQQKSQAQLTKTQATTTNSAQQLQKKFADLLNTLNSLEKNYKKGTFDSIKTETQQYLTQLKGLDEQTDGYEAKVQDATTALERLTTQTATTRAESKNLHGTLKEVASGFLQFQLSAMLVMKPLQLIRSALSSINETLVKTEDAVIALQRVLPSGSASDSEIASRLYKIAADYGQTFDNVQLIAQNFARTGMSWADTIKATEAAVLALNVAELDAEEATTGMVAILSQFKLEASDLETVIDKLNKTADNFPVTTEKILAALQRTGSAAANANLNLDQTISLITALSKATGRSGENLGTALNSLIQYSSKASALDVFAGLSNNTANVVAEYRKGAKTILDVWQAVAKEIQSLDTRQADLLDSYFSTEDGTALTEALDEELQDIYTELGGVYDTANTFRKNYFIALLGNMETVEQAMGTLSDAAGYSQDENQKYLDTYTAKLNTLKAQWEDIANSEQGILGIKKDLVELGSAFLTVMEWTGGLRTSLILLGSSLTAIFAPKIIKGLGSIGTVFKKLVTPLKSFREASEAAALAQDLQITATALQAEADEKAAIATTLKMSATATDAEIRVAETAATQAQTLATEAQTAADEMATIATNAKNTAMQTSLFLIGLLITAISIGVGVWQKWSQQQEENRKQQIENYRTIEGTYKELQKLNGQYKELADNVNRSEEQEKDFNDIETKLVEILKDKYNVLSLLTEGTDEYTEAVKRLADQEEKEYERNLIDAQKAAEKGLANAKIGRKNAQYGYDNMYANKNTEVKSILEILENAGIKISDSKQRYLDLNDSVKGNNVADQLYNYVQYSKALNALQDARNEALKVGDNERAEAIVNSEAWKNFKVAIDDTTTAVKDYFDTTVALKLVDYKTVFGDITTQEDYDKVLNWITNQINAGEYYNEIINNALAGLIDFSKLEQNTDNFWTNNIQEVTNKYDNLISKLEELRDLEDESVNLEEKKAEYLEAQNELIKAQQALEDARNQATVRRYNSATGQWEWQVDEKKVAEAEETVKKQEESVEKAREELEKQAYDTIISLLDKNNPPTNEELNDLLDGLIDFLGEQFIGDIKEAFKDKTNVDLNSPILSPEDTTEIAEANKPEKSDYELIKDAISSGVLRNVDGTVAEGSGINKSKIGDNGEVKWNGKTYKIENGGEISDENIINAVSELGLPDRTIFAYNGAIYGVLDGSIVKLQARAHSYGDNSDSGYKALLDTATSKGAYDSGGIANGLGYMPKATKKTETVNGPDLTAQILSPQSNREWETYARTMGIMFEQAHNFASNPIIERIGGNTDNSVNNSGQIIMNGVAIGSDKRDNTFNEVLRMVGLVNN